MAIFKCKMCGGTLEINENQTTATCEYCGTQQTLPKLDNDKKANLYDRANHFRRNNEFDKAMQIYENVLNEDNTDAEAYWSLVLCRYGIEYVEDPATHKRVPTVNRAQFTSIFDDDNYKSALQYADGYQKSLYEEEANAINEIQKGILAISQKEEPFDVFICYKETDNNGRRTQDSVLANDLYHQLTQEGFKVFFSRITLEDKLGTAYEPYIFAALNSARVMVSIGTKPEYFNAVWVKNEWSRYLALVKASKGKKVLIPAYKDMDPYDLPEEFSHLQAQDMSKLGFMQDLIRGIKKLAKDDTPKATEKETVIVNGGSANIEALLKRAFMYLEDGEWHSADEYCEKVLDQEPENAMAYVGKLMAQLNVRKQDSLRDQAVLFDGYNNYQKAIRFGDDELKDTLARYIEDVKARNEKARLEGLYEKANRKMNSAKTENAFKEAASIFENLGDFKNSAVLVTKCYEGAEAVRKDPILAEAKRQMTGSFVEDIEKAIELFESIPGWKDADEQIVNCKKKIEELQVKREKLAKRSKKFAIIGLPIICVIAGLVFLLITVIIPNVKYDKAVELMNNGKYQEAITAFEAMDGYKDSNRQILKCETAIMDKQYNDALALMNEGKTVEAYETLIALYCYKDSEEKADSIYKEYKREKLKSAKVGDYVPFGTYEQDDDTSNGKEDIEWLVLDKKGEKLLVISKYALDCQPYDSSETDVTWRTCTLRKWLNETFFSAAFSKEEKAMIPTVRVSADKNPEYDTKPGKDTQDKVFLLSIKEANNYFSSDSARQCKATAYADAQGANHEAWWWLRSPGYSQFRAAFVFSDGDVLEDGRNVGDSSSAVRPALWVDLNS